MGKLGKWVSANMHRRARGGRKWGRMGGKTEGTNSEAIIKWNMEQPQGYVRISTLHFDAMRDSVEGALLMSLFMCGWMAFALTPRHAWPDSSSYLQIASRGANKGD